jgi:hypothetical protein
MAGTEAETKETRTKKTGRKGKDVERKDVGSGDEGNENEEDRFFFSFLVGEEAGRRKRDRKGDHGEEKECRKK